MTVWLVTLGIPYEGILSIWVFSGKEKAEAFLKVLKTEKSPEHYEHNLYPVIVDRGKIYS